MMLYTGGRVFDGGSLLPEGVALLVEGSMIRRLAPIAEFEGYSGPRVDTNGMTVLTGLIDCHVHLVYAGEANPAAALMLATPAQIALKALDNAIATLKGGVTA